MKDTKYSIYLYPLKGRKGEHTDMDSGWKGTPGGLSKEIPLGEVSGRPRMIPGGLFEIPLGEICGRLRVSLQMSQVSALNRRVTESRG